MWLGIAILFLLGWIVGFVLVHVMAFGIHALLLIAAIALIIHFLGGGGRRSRPR